MIRKAQVITLLFFYEIHFIGFVAPINTKCQLSEKYAPESIISCKSANIMNNDNTLFRSAYEYAQLDRRRVTEPNILVRDSLANRRQHYLSRSSLHPNTPQELYGQFPVIGEKVGLSAEAF